MHHIVPMAISCFGVELQAAANDAKSKVGTPWKSCVFHSFSTVSASGSKEAKAQNNTAYARFPT